MLGWLIPLVVAVLGLLGVYLNHKLQQVRERDARAAQERAAWVARRRAMCATLLESAMEERKRVAVVEKLHANPTSDIGISRAHQDATEHARKVGEAIQQVIVELALEPNAPLWLAMVKFGDVEQAYFDALMKPLLSEWTYYVDQTPPDELDRLREAGVAAWLELKSTVRDYLAGLEQPAPTAPRWRLPWPRKRQAQSLARRA